MTKDKKYNPEYSARDQILMEVIGEKQYCKKVSKDLISQSYGDNYAITPLLMEMIGEREYYKIMAKNYNNYPFTN